jgi:hypothetical protein
MTGPAHDRATLGAFAIGALDPVEARMVHEHLNGCLECQREVNELMMIRRALDQVPPEAFLDGPPADGDLLLRRTLRRVSTEAGPGPAQLPRRRSAVAFIAAAAAVVVAAGGGLFLGRETAPSTKVAGPTVTTESTPANARIIEATNPDNGAAMTVALEPKKGWVWVHATATGLPEGEPCELIIIPKEGKAELAGSWMVSAEGAKKSTLEGMALIAPEEVESVVIKVRNGEDIIKATV